MHEALRMAEEKYYSIFDEAIVGIFQSEPGGRYVTANLALARMFGYDSPEDFMLAMANIGHGIYVDPRSGQEFRLRMEKEGSVRNFVVQVYRKDGSVMWLSVNARALYQDGCVVGYEGMSEDITERKLLECQFLRAQKMEAVGQLAGGMAHDFNNLLGVILGHGELLLQRLRASDPVRRRVEQICEAGRRAVSLTRQLLAFSRQQVLSSVLLDLNKVIQHANDMIGPLIGDDIQVVLRLDPALGRVRADAVQIEQILLNLAVNSRDAMPQGGGLTIETSNFEIDETFAQRHLGTKQGHCVLLAVTDTGSGMDQRTLNRVFEPFFTTKEADRGTGLGLATVYGIVKQDGGYITVTSEPGKGTTFEIYFPRVDETVEPLAERDRLSPAAQGSETVLIVEDTASLREVTREFLESVGFQVLEAGGGDEALKVADRYDGPICLLITDVVMPRMNGHTLAQRLKSTRPEMKVLYVSGYADKEIFRYGMRPSQANFLHKPYTQDALTSKLREVIDAVT